MKINLPVTAREVDYPESLTLVSNTDLKGVVTYVNQDFIDISGFGEDELIGSSHNVVRHPDMPPEAFADLWQTLQQGRPWTGVVKNRCKNGDHYWVVANVTPIKEGDRVTGYMSVRAKPSREQIAAAEHIYRKIRDKELSPAKVFRKPGRLKRLPLTAKFALGAGALALGLAAAGLAPVAGGVLLSGALGFFVLHAAVRPLPAAAGHLDRIAQGDYRSEIDIGREGETGRLLHALKSMQIKLGFDVNEAKRVANEALRIQAALDSASTNVMIGDNNGRIIYMNQAIQGMFRDAEADIRTDLPDFRADALMGANFDAFHKNPAHQRGLLQSLSGTHRAAILIGGRTFRLTANPVVNGERRRLGTSVEWIDATQEVKIENEVKAIVHAAAEGDFGRRLSLEGKEGFMKELSANINLLLETSDAGLNEMLRVLEAISRGDLSQKITNDYRGTFGQLKDYGNTTVDVLSRIVSQLEHVVAEANRGNFKVNIDADGMAGFQKDIADGINTLMKTSDAGLGEVLRVLGALAQGDLTETISNDYQGTFGQLKDYSNTTVESLRELVGRIKEAVDAIHTASGEIAAGNQDLSQRTEEQASSLEETASSMEQLTATVKHNADNAQQASRLAVSASGVASRGGEVVRTSVETMAEISASSKKIADIISVIDGIAFQTNILALNAAVEAARAGEQGRGFAVVAGEVRNLAQRSANAAKEIKELITDSVAKVDSGTAQVNRAGDTMEDIVGSVKQVTDIMGEISAASSEQSAGIEQVNQAITQMDEITQQNAALVEQAAAAAESMQEQAEQLAQAVAVFKLEHRPAAMAPTAPTTPVPARKRLHVVGGGGQEEWQEF